MAEITTAGAPEAGQTAGRQGWQRRPFLATSARAAISLAPIVVSFAAALLLNYVIPRPVNVVTMLARVVLIVVASVVVLAVVDRQARKLLPLAALLQLSLLFPDQMPNRFKMALKAGSGRRMAREVEQARVHGLSDDQGLASEQLVLLATAIGDHDRRTRGHSERVRLFADLIAEELAFSPEERAKLQWAALIHDIGKIAVPPEILNKKGAPTKREWEILRTHPAAGEALAAPVAPWLGQWVHAIGSHHEKWDGTGYPRGLAGAAIPRAATIVAVADSFEVMTAVRSYKKAMPLTEARAELTRCAGTHFDPDIVRALLSVSIGRLRGAMGIFAGLAHLPFIGPLTTAAAHAPDTVAAAVGATTSGATAGLSMAAIGGAMILGPTTPTSAYAATATTVNVIDALQGPQTFAAEAPPTPTTSEPPIVQPRPRSLAPANTEAVHSSTTTTTVPDTSPPATPPVQPVQIAQVQTNQTAHVVAAPPPLAPVVPAPVAHGHADSGHTDKAKKNNPKADKGNSDQGNSDQGHGNNNS